MRERTVLILALGLMHHVRAQQTLPIQIGTWSIQHTYILGSQTETETVTMEYTPILDSYMSEGLNWGFVGSTGFSGMSMPDRIAVDSGRVYYRPTGWDTTAQVLYDFNLVEGDTAYIDWNAQAAVVELADTMMVAGRPWRHLELSNEDEWVECMGSVHGLFRPCCYGYFENGFELNWFEALCMDTDSTTYDVHWPFDQGFIESSQAQVQVYPNPTDGSFTIAGPADGGWYQVADLKGIRIASGPLQGSNTTARLAQPAPGLYVVTVNGQRTKLMIE